MPKSRADICEPILFFPTAAELRAWLEAHHDTERELLVGYHKVGSGRPSVSWPESVDQALCYGWIDGIRKSVDKTSYTVRFTPRTPDSTWSLVNIRRARALIDAGLMRPAGQRAFEARADEKSELYAYEQRRSAELDDAQLRQFRANAEAWSFFQAQPAWYRRTAAWWIVSAKRAETRTKRLATLIEYSERGQSIPPLARRTPGK